MKEFVLNPLSQFELCTLQITGDSRWAMMSRLLIRALLFSVPAAYLFSPSMLTAVNFGVLVCLCVVLTGLFCQQFIVEVFESSEGDRFARVTPKRTPWMVFYRPAIRMFNLANVSVSVKRENNALSVILDDSTQHVLLARAGTGRTEEVLESAKQLSCMLGLGFKKQ